jgi:hypothetical protein
MLVGDGGRERGGGPGSDLARVGPNSAHAGRAEAPGLGGKLAELRLRPDDDGDGRAEGGCGAERFGGASREHPTLAGSCEQQYEN